MNVGAHQLGNTGLGAVGGLRLLDAAAPGEYLDAPVFQLRQHTLDNENKVAFGEAHGHGGGDGGKYAQAYGVGKRLLAALLVLLGLYTPFSGWPLLLRVMDGTFGVGTDFAKLALLRAFGDDGHGHGFAGLVLRPIPVLLRVGVLRLDLDVLVAGQGRAASDGGGCGRSKGRRDLYQLGLCRDGLRDKAVQLGLVASRVGASVFGNVGEE